MTLLRLWLKSPVIWLLLIKIDVFQCVTTDVWISSVGFPADGKVTLQSFTSVSTITMWQIDVVDLGLYRLDQVTFSKSRLYTDKQCRTRQCLAWPKQMAMPPFDSLHWHGIDVSVDVGGSSSAIVVGEGLKDSCCWSGTTEVDDNVAGYVALMWTSRCWHCMEECKITVPPIVPLLSSLNTWVGTVKPES